MWSESGNLVQERVVLLGFEVMGGQSSERLNLVIQAQKGQRVQLSKENTPSFGRQMVEILSKIPQIDQDWWI